VGAAFSARWWTRRHVAWASQPGRCIM